MGQITISMNQIRFFLLCHTYLIPALFDIALSICSGKVLTLVYLLSTFSSYFAAGTSYFSSAACILFHVVFVGYFAWKFLM